MRFVSSLSLSVCVYRSLRHTGLSASLCGGRRKRLACMRANTRRYFETEGRLCVAAQGMDFYAAACAPHVTGAVFPMRIQASTAIYLWLFLSMSSVHPFMSSYVLPRALIFK